MSHSSIPIPKVQDVLGCAIQTRWAVSVYDGIIYSTVANKTRILQPKWLQEIHHHLVRSSRLKIGLCFWDPYMLCPPNEKGMNLSHPNSFVGALSLNPWCQPILANETVPLPPSDLDDCVGPKVCRIRHRQTSQCQNELSSHPSPIPPYLLPEPVPGRPWPA